MEIKFLKSMTRLILVISTLLALFTCCTCFGAERVKDAEDIYNSGCRIYRDTVAGSGAVVHQDENGDLYVFTNHHVAGQKGNRCRLNFFGDGNCNLVPAEVIWSYYSTEKSIDVSILKVDGQYSSFCPCYLPVWNSDKRISDEAEVEFITAGAPKAQWLSERKGRLKQNGDNNATFAPTPYGGQSGSGIAVKAKDGLYYWAWLITWRTDNEGTEGFGGLAQPASKIIKAMNGEVADIFDPLPVNAVVTPASSDAETGWGREVIIDGKKAWEVSGPGLPDYEMQDWSIAGCDPCLKARTYWNPKIAQEGVKVTVHHGDGNERYVADSLGISNYPTYILFDKDKNEVKRWIGYYAENELDILNTIKKIKQDIADQKIKDELKVEKKKADPDVECDDETCRLFGNRQYCQPQQQQPSTPKADNSQSESGRFEFFSLPKTDGEKKEEPKTEPQERERLLPKLIPNIPRTEPIVPKIEPKVEKQKKGLFGLRGKIQDKLNEKKMEITMSLFWLMFFACTLALFCYKFTEKILRCIWWGIKKAFTWIHDKIAAFFSNGIQSAVAQLKEAVEKQEEKTTTKKTKE